MTYSYMCPFQELETKTLYRVRDWCHITIWISMKMIGNELQKVMDYKFEKGKITTVNLSGRGEIIGVVIANK